MSSDMEGKMQSRYDAFDAEMRAAHKAGRIEGIVVGLEMADKFVSLTKSREDIASMIKVAIAAAKL